MQDSKSWLADLEEQKPIVVFALTLICAALIVFSSLRNPADYDGWWHLAMGADLIQQGLTPFKDHYSFTYYGEEITNPPVAFQVTYYFLNSLLGDHGGQVAIKALAFLLCLVLMLAWLHQNKSPVVVYALALPLLVTALQFRMQVRPELFSYFLFFVAFLLYKRADLRLGFKQIAPIALLLLVWTNYHSALFGYIIFFGLFVDIGFRLLKERAQLNQWIAWGAWGLVLIAVGFLNPSQSHAVLESLTFPSEWKTLIAEYRQPTYLLTMPSAYLLFLVAICAVVLSLTQKRIGYLAILAIFLYAATTMARMVSPAALICLIILIDALSRSVIWEKISAQTWNVQKFSAIFFGGVVASTLVLNVLLARQFLAENRDSWTMFPTALLQYVNQKTAPGKIFNAYAMGGYLLHGLSPNHKVYIDGRTQILYPVEHFLNWQRAHKDTGLFLAEVEKYDIRYAVLPNNSDTELLMASAGFGLDFSDNRYSFYDRNGGSLVLLGRLSARPACWSHDKEINLAAELSLFFAGDPPASAYILPLAAAVNEFVRAEDKKAYATTFDVDFLQTEPSQRFFAFRALEQGHPELALQQLNQLRTRQPKDELAIILALLKSEDIDGANNAMQRVLDEMIDWQNVEVIDLVILRALIKELAVQSDMSYLNPELLSELDMVVEGQSVSISGNKLIEGFFCSNSPASKDQ